jgi:hypothetical protein
MDLDGWIIFSFSFVLNSGSMRNLSRHAPDRGCCAGRICDDIQSERETNRRCDNLIAIGPHRQRKWIGSERNPVACRAYLTAIGQGCRYASLRKYSRSENQFCRAKKYGQFPGVHHGSLHLAL